MNKFSETLLNNLNEMEFLTKTLASVQLHYFNINQNLADIIDKTRFCLLNATLDLAIDLEHKIHSRVNKDCFIKQAVENLNTVYKNLHYFPSAHKIAQFEEIEIEILMISDFVKQYAINSDYIIAGLSLEDRKVLSSKFLAIKSRRTI
jgi:hypothetical protein